MEKLYRFKPEAMSASRPIVSPKPPPPPKSPSPTQETGLKPQEVEG